MLLFIKWKVGGIGEGKPNGAITAASSGAEMPWRTKEKQGIRLYKGPRGILHSGQQQPGIGLRTWLGSDQLGAVAACGQVWKGCWCTHTLPSSQSSSVVSGNAETTSMAWTHGKSWTLEGIAESLICLPVMAMKLNYFFSPLLCLLKNMIENACKQLNIVHCFRISFSSCLHSILLWGHTGTLNSCLWCFCIELIPVSLITKLGKGKTEFPNWWHIYTRIVTL